MPRWTVLALLLALSLTTACKKKAVNPVVAEALAEARKAKAAACACKDVDCADQAVVAQETWFKDSKDKLAGVKFSLDQVKQREADLKAAEACATKLGDPLAAEILTALGGYRDRVCACKDMACVEQVENEEGKWLLDNQAKYARAKASKRQTELADAIAAADHHCATAMETKTEHEKAAAAKAAAEAAGSGSGSEQPPTP